MTSPHELVARCVLSYFTRKTSGGCVNAAVHFCAHHTPLSPAPTFFLPSRENFSMQQFRFNCTSTSVTVLKVRNKGGRNEIRNIVLLLLLLITILLCKKETMLCLLEESLAFVFFQDTCYTDRKYLFKIKLISYAFFYMAEF